MGEERINRVKIEDLPQPEQELTPEEAQHVKGGIALSDAALASREQQEKRGGDLSAKEEESKKL
jgi:hypothetical protein